MNTESVEPVESEPVESEPVESEPVESEPVESEPLGLPKGWDPTKLQEFFSMIQNQLDWRRDHFGGLGRGFIPEVEQLKLFESGIASFRKKYVIDALENSFEYQGKTFHLSNICCELSKNEADLRSVLVRNNSGNADDFSFETGRVSNRPWPIYATNAHQLAIELILYSDDFFMYGDVSLWTQMDGMRTEVLSSDIAVISAFEKVSALVEREQVCIRNVLGMPDPQFQPTPAEQQRFSSSDLQDLIDVNSSRISDYADDLGFEKPPPGPQDSWPGWSRDQVIDMLKEMVKRGKSKTKKNAATALREEFGIDI